MRLFEQPRVAKRAVDLVGAHVVKEPVVVGGPAFAAGFEEVECPLDVGPNELAWAADTSVDVAFGGEVHHEIWVELVKHRIDAVHVRDVDPAQRVVRQRLDVAQAAQIRGVGELVEIDELMLSELWHQPVQEIGADEAGTARDNDLHRLFSASENSITGTISRCTSRQVSAGASGAQVDRQGERAGDRSARGARGEASARDRFVALEDQTDNRVIEIGGDRQPLHDWDPEAGAERGAATMTPHVAHQIFEARDYQTTGGGVVVEADPNRRVHVRDCPDQKPEVQTDRGQVEWFIVRPLESGADGR
jgi:hypothetical protein